MKHYPFPLTLALSLILTPGCAHRNDEPFHPVALDGPAAGYIRLADDWLTRNSPGSNVLSTFTCADAKVGCFQEFARWPRCGKYRPVMFIHYERLKPIPVFDANDIQVWGFMDTNECRIVGP